MGVGWEDRVEDTFDMSASDDQGEPAEQGVSGDFEGGQSHSAGKLQAGVRQQGKWQLEPLCSFELLFGLLRGQAHDRGTVLGELPGMVSKPARFGRAPTRPGDEAQSSTRGASPGRPVRG